MRGVARGPRERVADLFRAELGQSWALLVPDEEKGRAAGWYNAGNLGGVGVGGWAGLKLASALPHGWQVGAVMGAVMLDRVALVSLTAVIGLALITFLPIFFAQKLTDQSSETEGGSK